MYLEKGNFLEIGSMHFMLSEVFMFLKFRSHKCLDNKHLNGNLLQFSPMSFVYDSVGFDF